MVALEATNFSLETWKVEQIYVSEMFDLAMLMGYAKQSWNVFVKGNAWKSEGVMAWRVGQ